MEWKLRRTNFVRCGRKMCSGKTATGTTTTKIRRNKQNELNSIWTSASDSVPPHSFVHSYFALNLKCLQLAEQYTQIHLRTNPIWVCNNNILKQLRLFLSHYLFLSLCSSLNSSQAGAATSSALTRALYGGERYAMQRKVETMSLIHTKNIKIKKIAGHRRQHPSLTTAEEMFEKSWHFCLVVSPLHTRQ